jgi:hypothetical protein
MTWARGRGDISPPSDHGVSAQERRPAHHSTSGEATEIADTAPRASVTQRAIRKPAAKSPKSRPSQSELEADQSLAQPQEKTPKVPVTEPVARKPAVKSTKSQPPASELEEDRHRQPQAKKREVSEAQHQANKRNATKSTGPRSPEGKRKVAQNSIKHGVHARSAFAIPSGPFAESEDDVKTFVGQIVDSLRPRDALEEAVAREIGTLCLNSHRLSRLSAQAVASHSSGGDSSNMEVVEDICIALEGETPASGWWKFYRKYSEVWELPQLYSPTEAEAETAFWKDIDRRFSDQTRLFRPING